ncbi:hypothetical protein BCR43DRAFT_484910 [Syncephalastrum racemosum]|uniref:Uncharacterized protein n=1 Tax=Syncephalastrum racemosum TaxID=13706 RepID=A0A1X2HLQ8_SYNRA|nr:hypothetical protein BCR43DRAFT_484910 [Syncephalastrum racemosum]
MDLDPTDDNLDRLEAFVVLLRFCLLSDPLIDDPDPLADDDSVDYVYSKRTQKSNKNQAVCQDAVRAASVIFATEILCQAAVEVNEFQGLHSFMRLLAYETFVKHFQEDSLLQCLADVQSKADTRICAADLETLKASLPQHRTYLLEQFERRIETIAHQIDRALGEEEALVADVKAMQIRATEDLQTEIMPRVTRLCETNNIERKNRHNDLRNEVIEQINARTLQSRLNALQQTLQGMEDSMPWKHIATMTRLSDTVAQHDQSIRYIHETTRILTCTRRDQTPMIEHRSVKDDLRKLESLWEEVKRLGQQALKGENTYSLNDQIDRLLSVTAELQLYMDQYRDTVCRSGLYEDVVSQLNYINDIVVNHDILLRNIIDPKDGLNGLPITRELVQSHVFRRGKAFSRPVEEAVEKVIEARVKSSIIPLLERIDKLEQQVQSS